MTAPSPLRPARVRVPGSTSNLGAGFDCVGLALDRYLTAEYEPGAGPLRLERSGTLAGLAAPPEEDRLFRSFRAQCARRGLPEPTGVLRAHSEIPVARGLGTSAAAVVAGIALAAAAAGARSVDRRAALADAERVEGHPDNAAPSLFGGLVAVARNTDGASLPMRLPLSSRVGFTFAAPAAVVETPAARRVLPDAVPHAAAVRGTARLAALLHGLGSGDAELIRAGFVDELHVPYRLPLIPGGEESMAAGVEAGAWAVTISGSGSGLIAACPPDRAAAVADAMAETFRRAGGPSGADGVVAFPAMPDREGVRIGDADRWR